MNRHAAGLQPLRAGSACALPDGLDLRYVSWDDDEVLRRLYFAVRDPEWGTVAPDSVVMVPVDHGAGLAWRASFELPGGEVRVRSEMRLSADSLSCEVLAQATGEVFYNRIGWCVLLPPTLAGSQVTFRAPAGDATESLSHLVAPQPLGPTGPEPALGPFTDFRWEQGASAYRLSFTGDEFELEDQRNWTDASFKIYSTPLALPRPHRLPAGSTLRQTVALQRTQLPSAKPRSTPLPSAPQPANYSATRLSAVLSDASDTDLKLLASLGVQTLRIEMHPAEPDFLDRTTRRIAQARRAGFGYELTLWCDSGTPWDELRRLFDVHRPELVLILPADASGGTETEYTGPAVFEVAARELGDLPLAGGTPFNLCELQRHDLAHLPALTCTLTPTVHAVDRLSILETSESLPDIVTTLRARRPGAELALGPFQGRERRSDDPPGYRPSIDGLPAEWLSSSLDALVTSRVERLCIADVADLVRDGTPTRYGLAVNRPVRDRPDSTVTAKTTQRKRTRT